MPGGPFWTAGHLSYITRMDRLAGGPFSFLCYTAELELVLFSVSPVCATVSAEAVADVTAVDVPDAVEPEDVPAGIAPIMTTDVNFPL